jgi:hypothetical protein
MPSIMDDSLLIATFGNLDATGVPKRLAHDAADGAHPDRDHRRDRRMAIIWSLTCWNYCTSRKGKLYYRNRRKER